MYVRDEKCRNACAERINTPAFPARPVSLKTTATKKTKTTKTV